MQEHEDTYTSTASIHFPELQLDFRESRVLGALMEKEVTTPGNYPMSLNALESACNQSSNRHPVTTFSTREVEDTLERLRDKKLALRMNVAGSRVPKYKHLLPSVLELTEAEHAVMTVLLLRSVQTAGEIKQRTDRLHSFSSVDEVEEILQCFLEYGHGPLVQEIPAGHGRRVKTYAHLLGGEPGQHEGESANTSPTAEAVVLEEKSHWRTKLEEEIAILRREVDELKAFRASLE